MPISLCAQEYIGETGELALSAVIAGVDTAVNEEGGILAKREHTEQVTRLMPALASASDSCHALFVCWLQNA
jgi:hypothetical protein